MGTALWIVTGLLAVAFAGAGLMKLTKDKADLVASGQGWAEDLPDGLVKGIGALEVLAAVGLVVPPLLDTAEVLVPLAAVGLVLLMLGAIVTHARRREFPNIVVNVVLAALALLLAVQRFGDRAL
jgi:uncharacterized membrane protein YphA (DoxX/SURF4 family)